MYPFGQGYLSMGPAMREFLRRFQAGRIHHGGNPIVRFAVDNAVVRTDPAGNMKPDKEKSPQKIDPLVAVVMANDRYSRHG
jgi:phage terminase large subunit-like protein